MKFPKTKGVTDRSTILYNPHITLQGIPDEAHRYQLGPRMGMEHKESRLRTGDASPLSSKKRSRNRSKASQVDVGYGRHACAPSPGSP